MPFTAVSLSRRNWLRAFAWGMQLVFAVCVFYLVSVLVRLPIEDAGDSVVRYFSRRASAQALEQRLVALQAMSPAPVRPDPGLRAAYDPLRSAVAVGCAASSQAARQGQAEVLARMDAAYQNLQDTSFGGSTLPAGRAGPAFDAMLASLDEVRNTSLGCLENELTSYEKISRTLRGNVLAVIAMVVLMCIGVLYLRRIDHNRLRENLHLSEQLLDAIPLPLSLRSPQGNFLFMNRDYEKRMGVTREQAVGRPVIDTIKPLETARHMLEMDAQAAATNGAVDATVLLEAADGVRHIQVRVQAVRGLDGTPTGTVGIQSDMTTMADQLTETNARLSQLSMKMIGAQEEERTRIARDLHDQVGQILTVLKLQLSTLARTSQLVHTAGSLASPIDLVDEALRCTRDLSASLHPHMLDDLGLGAAVGWLVERFIRPSLPNIEMRFQLLPARSLPAIELVAFRVVQEALTNVVRHAGASRVGVMLEVHAGELNIEVIDDGVGFDAGGDWFDRQRMTSVGVTGMRDRVTEVGGELRMQSSLGNGTSVRARLPWKHQQGDANADSAGG
jgi:PAS domain S-box-containing protein